MEANKADAAAGVFQAAFAKAQPGSPDDIAGAAVFLASDGSSLCVRYVLEGSIRRSDDRVRITAQLIDAATGTHRWADRYDRNLEDVFAVQDEVARTIVAILAAHVNRAEIEQASPVHMRVRIGPQSRLPRRPGPQSTQTSS